MRWSLLSRFGSSRLVLTSYFWFVFVPIAAKGISALDSFAVQSGWPLALPALPFKWQIFFFAAFFFSLANIVFYLSCPTIVRNYRTAIVFKDEGKSATQLVELFMDVARRGPIGKRRRTDVARELAMTMNPEARVPDELVLAGPEISFTEMRNALLGVDAHKASLDESFWMVYDLADLAHPVVRYVAGTFYLLGLVMIAIVVEQNLMAVWGTATSYGLYQVLSGE